MIMKQFNSIIDDIKKSDSNDAEQYLYAILHEKYGHTDPYDKGIDHMAKLVDAFFRYISTRNSHLNSDKDSVGKFDGLITKKVIVQFHSKNNVVIKHDTSLGAGSITLPRISEETPNQQASRQERIGKEFYQNLPKIIYQQVETVIRGMPEKARKNLLKHYGDNK